MAEAKKLVEVKIAGKKVVVFSKSRCPHCRKAKDALSHYIPTDLPDGEYEVIELDQRADGDSIQAYLKKLTGASSVPRVFVNGKCIGGGDETQSLHQNGKLKALLAK